MRNIPTFVYLQEKNSVKVRQRINKDIELKNYVYSYWPTFYTTGY